MKKAAFAAAIGLCCSGLFFPPIGWCEGDSEDSSTGQAKRGPVFEAYEPIHSFGTIYEDDVEMVTHTFRFRNAGTQELFLREITPTCGCTAAIPSASSFAPGEEGTMVAVLDTEGRYGDQSVSVEIHTNERRKDRKRFLTLEGLILRTWGAIPEVLDLQEIVGGQTKEGLVTIYTQFLEGTEIGRITGVGSDADNVVAATGEYEIPSSPRKGLSYLELKRPITVRVTAGEEIGEATADLLVSTDDPKKPTVTIPIRWSVSGDLAASVNRVFLTRMRGKSRPRPLSIFSRNDIPFEVVSAKVEKSEGEPDVVEIVPAGNDSPSKKNFELVVSEDFKAGEKAESIKGQVVFETTHPEQKTLSVPFMATVRD